MTTPTNDEAYYAEAKAQREHDLKVEEIHRRDREDRRSLIAGWWVGSAVVVILLGIAFAIVAGVRHHDDTQLRIEQERKRVAQLCIDAGNIWVNDNCIPSQKQAR